jgi:chemotaxis response regulator CheB
MARLRVLVVDNLSLMGAGIEELLKHDAGIDVLGIAGGDISELMQHVRKFRPNVIILHDQSPSSAITNILTQTGAQYPMRIVVVEPDDNQMQVYDRDRISVAQLRDLLDVVKIAFEPYQERRKDAG